MNTAVKEVQVIKATITGEKTEKIRVAAYCRVSTDKDDQLNSFFAQMRYYRDYVRGNDKMVLVDIYADEGITGTELTKRDEMKRLIRDCKHKKIDRVLVKSVTRFARNSLECIETIRTMQSCGVSVLFENDHIDTETMNSEMMLYIKSAFAQSEATSASKRMSTSIRMKMEDGTYVATSAPFGYRLVDGEYAPVTILAVRVCNVEYEVFVTVVVVIRNAFSALCNSSPLRVPLFKRKAYARVRSLDNDLTGVVQCDMRIVRNETIKRFQLFSVHHHRLNCTVSICVSSDVAQFFFHLLCLFSCKGNSFPNTSKYICCRSSKVGKNIAKQAADAPIVSIRIRRCSLPNSCFVLSLYTNSFSSMSRRSAI